MSFRFSSPQGPFHLGYLAEQVGASLITERQPVVVFDLAPLATATNNQISMLHQKKYIQQLKSSQAAACIIAPEYVIHAPTNMSLLVHKNPYKAYALIAQIFYPNKATRSFIAPTASVASTAQIGTDCSIAHGAYIGDGVKLGARCTIGVNTYIGDNVQIGDDCCIENNVSISHSVIGKHVVVYPGARIGQDGFGFASDKEGHYKIPHTGGVIIGNHVEIGANTCIDRGSINNTVIADWCRIDNLVQIGHNVSIGRGSILCGQVGIAGSSSIGEYVTLAGKVGISSHIHIGDSTTVLVGSTATRDIASNKRVGGFPAVDDKMWHKQTAFLKRQTKPKS